MLLTFNLAISMDTSGHPMCKRVGAAYVHIASHMCNMHVHKWLASLGSKIRTTSVKRIVQHGFCMLLCSVHACHAWSFHVISRRGTHLTLALRNFVSASSVAVGLRRGCCGDANQKPVWVLSKEVWMRNFRVTNF